MKFTVLNRFTLFPAAAGMAMAVLSGCGASASPAPAHHVARSRPVTARGPAHRANSCAGTVTFSRPDSTGSLVFHRLASAPCAKAMAILPTGVPIGWLARLNARANRMERIKLTITRISGPGRHPQVVYVSRALATRERTAFGSLSRRQLNTLHITPAVYSAIYTGRGTELAHSTFQMGDPAPGMAHGY